MCLSSVACVQILLWMVVGIPKQDTENTTEKVGKVTEAIND